MSNIAAGDFVMKSSVVLLVLFCYASDELHLCFGDVYNVGDSSGWTTIGNVDYKLWSASKSFQLGDIIVFVYNPKFHNVMQVTHGEYKSCNATSPIATHTTGNDSVTITGYGHHFFLCAVPGHCQAGQKIDINVIKSTPALTSAPLSPPVAPAASALPSPTPTPEEEEPKIKPTPSDASSRLASYGQVLMNVALAIVIVFNIETLPYSII